MPFSWRLAIGTAIVLLAGGAFLARGGIGTRGQAAAGILCFIGLAAMCSANLRAVNPRTLVWGFALQLALALFVTQVEFGYKAFESAGQVVKKFLEFSAEGAQFVFGVLADPKAMEKPFGKNNGFVFAFTALPTIIFVSSFFSVLYYFGVLQWLVALVARVMRYLMQTSGAETVSVTASVFMGQTEAPLIVKPYVPRMTRSELLALMVGGMAHISGGLMAVYIGMGADPVAILTTSIMASPCTLYMTKLMLPEMERPETGGDIKPTLEKPHANVIDAAASGASDGMHLALNVAAMLIAFIALIALVNSVLGLIHPDLSLARIFSVLFAPVAFLMGLSGDDVPRVADLLGTKLVLNEFVAFTRFKEYGEALSPRGRFLATFALTGFANFASIGIQLGGIGGMAPGRRHDLARLGGKALFVGFLVTLVNASLAGLLMHDPGE
ncbi:MAG: Na+ dependent nucleoside transporter domain protein [Planctomycetes bacterium]|nr:Na+ dependent nucleoside transporter domain protein [Planctomycetota bacterium]